MTRAWRITLVALVALSGAVVIVTTCRQPSNPVIQGKRVSVWHKELCYGVFGGRSKIDDRLFEEAYKAFSHMGAEAVPYLAAELQRLRSERLEQAFRWARKQSITRPLLRNTVGPTERRCYAAVALRQMGPSAVAAVPALLEAWKHDCPEVKLNCVHALASIMYGVAPEGMRLADAKVFEAKVIADAAQRCPEVARDLGISVDIPQPVAASPSR
jgi:hypothetical protein